MLCRTQRRRRTLAALVPAAAAVMGLAHVAPGATFNVSWVGPNSSVYNSAANWSGGVVPSNTLSNVYNVTVNKPGGATVGGNVPATINNLTIGAGNRLIPQSEKELTIVGSNGTATINNAGTLAVTAAIPYSRLTLNAATTNLTGGGTLAITNGVVGGTGVLTSNNYITGRGSFGNDTLRVINNGTILAGDPDFDAQSLVLNPGDGAWVNTGTMLSGNNGVLSLYDGTFNNANGFIRANTGTVSIYQSAVNGGTITALSSGTVSVSNSTVFGAHLGAAGGGLVRVANNASTFDEVFNHGNLALAVGATGQFASINNNSGTIHVGHASGPGSATLSFGSGTTTFTGNGTILLNSSAPASVARVAGTGTLVNGNSIIGSGAFVGGAIQNGGLIRSTGDGILFQPVNTGTGGFNYGTFNVQSGSEMTIARGHWVNLGTFLVDGNATLKLHATAGAASFLSSGTLTVGAGGTLETSTLRTLDTTGGYYRLNLASTANLGGPLNAGSVQLHGNLNQTGPMTAQEVAGVGILNLTAATTTATARHLRIAELRSAGTMTIAPDGTDAGVSRFVAPPQFTGGGRLDLSDNDLVIDYTTASPLATIKSQIQTGYADGAWTGAQLTSSAAASDPGFALGYGEASAVFASFPAQFGGQGIDPSTVLVKYTRYGDANLDGAVTLQDFNKLAAHFGSNGAVWTEGDFNYDGIVNLQDFNRLAGNFGLVASGPAVTPDDWSALAAAVPEPVHAGALVLAIAPLLRRRRR